MADTSLIAQSPVSFLRKSELLCNWHACEHNQYGIIQSWYSRIQSDKIRLCGILYRNILAILLIVHDYLLWSKCCDDESNRQGKGRKKADKTNGTTGERDVRRQGKTKQAANALTILNQ